MGWRVEGGVWQTVGRQATVGSWLCVFQTWDGVAEPNAGRSSLLHPQHSDIATWHSAAST